MDYFEWGGEYLAEAAKLKKHAELALRECRAASGEDALLQYSRYSMLRRMYLECLRTGRELQERGSRQ